MKFSEELSIAHLRPLEEFLAQVLLMPANEPAEAPDHLDTDYEPANSGINSDVLEASEKSNSIAQRLLSNYPPQHLKVSPTSAALLLSVWSWAGKQGHAEHRNQLIRLLFDLRESLIDRLRKMPAQPAQIIAGKSWPELSEKYRRILEAVSGKQLLGKEIASAMNVDQVSISRELSALRKLGILENKAGSGYWISQVPTGAPAIIKRFASDG